MHLGTCITLAIAVAGLPLVASAAADADDGWHGHLRFRHESVDDDAFTRDARADTLRLGYRRALGHGFSAGLEMEGVAALGDSFNSTANGATGHPVVADPASLETNQAWLRWQRTKGGATLDRRPRVGGDEAGLDAGIRQAARPREQSAQH